MDPATATADEVVLAFAAGNLRAAEHAAELLRRAGAGVHLGVAERGTARVTAEVDPASPHAAAIAAALAADPGLQSAASRTYRTASLLDRIDELARTAAGEHGVEVDLPPRPPDRLGVRVPVTVPDHLAQQAGPAHRVAVEQTTGWGEPVDAHAWCSCGWYSGRFAQLARSESCVHHSRPVAAAHAAALDHLGYDRDEHLSRLRQTARRFADAQVDLDALTHAAGQYRDLGGLPD